MHTEVQHRRNRISQLRAARGAGKGLTEPGHNLGDDDPLVIVERAALTKQDAELARLKRLEEQHGARRRFLAALVNAAETWIKTASASMKIAMYPVEPPQLKKGESIADAVERLRRRGRELQADLDRVRAAPWPSALARERMRAQIASMAEAGRPLAHHLVDHGEPVAFATRIIPAGFSTLRLRRSRFPKFRTRSRCSRGCIRTS